jgi:hypothetical protein
MRFVISAAAFLAAVLSACSSGPYHYVPAKGQLSGGQLQQNDVVYGVPESGSSGTLRVRYLGTETNPDTAGLPQGKFIHVILVAQNDTETDSWNLDSKNLYVAFPHEVRSQAVAADPGVLKVDPGERIGMDVYFPFPKQYATADQVPGFVLHWKIETPQKDYAHNTAYRRVSGSQNQSDYEAGWNAPYNVPDAVLFGGPEYGWL